MTGDEMERAIEFLLKGQAKHEARLGELTEPTRATHPAATFGSPLRCTKSRRIPLSRTTSCTGTFCAATTYAHRSRARRLKEILFIGCSLLLFNIGVEE